MTDLEKQQAVEWANCSALIDNTLCVRAQSGDLPCIECRANAARVLLELVEESERSALVMADKNSDVEWMQGDRDKWREKCWNAEVRAERAEAERDKLKEDNLRLGKEAAAWRDTVKKIRGILVEYDPTSLVSWIDDRLEDLGLTLEGK